MWVPTNIHSKSGTKDREDSVFKYIKKSGKKKGTISAGFKGFTEIKKMTK